jgi:hypothetical protein
VSIDIEGPYGSEVVIDILRAFRLDEPHSLAQPQKPQDVPSLCKPAKIKQQRKGFSDFFEVGVGEHRLEIGGEKGTRSPLAFSRVPRPHYSTYARANTLLTDFAYHWPPRAVLTPRALRASAIWWKSKPNRGPPFGAGLCSRRASFMRSW